MMQTEISTIKQASRNFGAVEITKEYLLDPRISVEAKAVIRELQEKYFKNQGLER